MASDDLVQRLREFGDIDSDKEWRHITAKAADRIEQLERELSIYKNQVDTCNASAIAADNMRLERELAEAQPALRHYTSVIVALGYSIEECYPSTPAEWAYQKMRQLAEARADTERLDWLEGKGDPNYDGPPRLNLVTDRWWREDVDVRQALDAAKGERDE